MQFRLFSRKYLARIKHFWGAGTGSLWRDGEIQHWLQHPLVQERINLKVSGMPGVNRFEYFLNHYLNGKMPVERALTLGSGVGELERGLSHYNFARLHEGVDISEYVVQTATEKAASLGLTHLQYSVGNLNQLALRPLTYDVIFGVSSIHHVDRLEHVFRQVQQALKPGGYFFLDEYIGPTRFYWTDEQLRVMNEQLSLLPRKLRRSITNNRNVKSKIERKSLQEFLSADPSEAIRSSEILGVLSQFFTILDFRGYGGTILHELLYDIAGNFTEDNPGSLDLLRRLFEVEDALVDSGRLGHDFAVVIATPKSE
jgi:SAM-dependent methyltransferase